jgi:hypothetical protein
MRDIQEWMGHRDYRTTLIYADSTYGITHPCFGMHRVARVDLFR